MTKLRWPLLFVAAFFLLQTERTLAMSIKKVTPMLLAEKIEAVLPFWNALGFEVSTQVDVADQLGFVILNRGDLEIMYQTISGVRNDAPGLLSGSNHFTAILYLEVKDLDGLLNRIENTEVAVQRRTTFYGADEIFLRDPAGNLIGLAEMSAVTEE